MDVSYTELKGIQIILMKEPEYMVRGLNLQFKPQFLSVPVLLTLYIISLSRQTENIKTLNWALWGNVF